MLAYTIALSAAGGHARHTMMIPAVTVGLLVGRIMGVGRWWVWIMRARALCRALCERGVACLAPAGAGVLLLLDEY